jgi:asparaginyl-tRNA synthetase
MKTLLIKELLASPADSRAVAVSGWVRTKRESKNLVFLQVSDGSCFSPIQLAFDRSGAANAALERQLPRVTTGASVRATGRLVPSPAAGQAAEIALETLEVLGEAPADSYPLQKKRHSFEFLRENAHLRARTNTFGAVARVRSQLSFAVHSFFQERGFQYFSAPIITASDAEGAGEMFQVTTLSLEKLAEAGVLAGAKGKRPESAAELVCYEKDFFGRRTSLTVSGQLAGETYAAALSRIYTFGPTFRAENSNTARHIAEFWMIEPEMSFYDLDDDAALAEEFIKYLLNWALDKCAEDMRFFDERIKRELMNSDVSRGENAQVFDARSRRGLIDTLRGVADSPFQRVTYTEAVAELEKNRDSFEFKPFWGCDLQSEHEKYLTEQAYRKPVIVTDYPKEIKAFYMKLNGDGKTVRALDVLVPGLGEIIGGSQREEDCGVLLSRMIECGLSPDDYWWYLDLRRFGTVPHSGFGLGFERLLMYVTGMTNIRDVIPYPRAPRQADF